MRTPVTHIQWDSETDIETEVNVTTFAALVQWSVDDLENGNHHSLNSALHSFRAFISTLDKRRDVPKDVLDGIWNGFVSLHNNL